MKKILSCLFVVLLSITIAACSEEDIDHYEQALQYIEANDRGKAIEELDQAIKADPDNPELYIRRAYCRMMADQNGLVQVDAEQIRQDLEKALSLDPDNEEAMRGIYYLELMLNRYEEAAKQLEDLVAGKDISEETKDLLENAKSGTVKDTSGKTRVQTSYYQGKLVMRTYFDMGEDGRISKVRSYDSDNHLIGEVDVRYNENGDYLTWVSFTEGGTMFRTEYEYDSQGNNTCQSNYNMDGSLKEQWTNEYDGNGNRIRTTIDVIGGSTQIHEYGYDSAGNRTSDYAYYDSGDLIYFQLMEYDGEGKIQRIDYYDKNGDFNYYSTFEYDESGKQIRYARYSADGNLEFEQIS